MIRKRALAEKHRLKKAMLKYKPACIMIRCCWEVQRIRSLNWRTHGSLVKYFSYNLFLLFKYVW